MPGMGMLGSLGSSSQMRPGGMPSHPQRPVQSSLRPPPSTQNSQPAGPQVSILGLFCSSQSTLVVVILVKINMCKKFQHFFFICYVFKRFPYFNVLCCL